tara:strand:+ start:82 stop:1062 length:981 start_codon:yes stop_codon:yes gene_type:complete
MSFDSCTHAILNSGICVLPTETVYGLACSALSKAAIEKVFSLKGRPSNNPLIVHVLNHDSANEFCVTNDFSKKLSDFFWPGALTLVLPKRKCIPIEITAGLNTVAIRSPTHPTFRKVLNFVKLPIAAPSANPSNKLSPTKYQDVLDAFGEDCPPIIDGGQCEIGIESTVLDLTTQTPSILRLGPITKDEIEAVLKIQIQNKALYTKKHIVSPIKSPGLGSKHYAPDTPLHLHSTFKSMISSKFIGENDVVILPKDKVYNGQFKTNIPILFLSTSNNHEETAKYLYGILREADKLNREKIHISLYSTHNESFNAINDRLTRASTKRI